MTDENTPLDISELLEMNFDDIKRPPALPGGFYHGTIQSYEFTRGRFASKIEEGEKERVVRFRISLQEPTEDLAPLVNGVDVAGKTFAWDVSLESTDKSAGGWRLKNALKGIGLTVDGRTVSTVLPEVTQLPVLVKIRKKALSNDVSAEFNDVERVFAQKEERRP